jgi:hypothetical protein
MGRLLIATFGDSKPFGSRVNFYQTTRCYIPEDSNLHTYRRENLKSYLVNLYGEATHRYVRSFETLRIKSKLLPDYRVLQPRRQQSSYSPPWEPQILFITSLDYNKTCGVCTVIYQLTVYDFCEFFAKKHKWQRNGEVVPVHIAMSTQICQANLVLVCIDYCPTLRSDRIYSFSQKLYIVQKVCIKFRAYEDVGYIIFSQHLRYAHSLTKRKEKFPIPGNLKTFLTINLYL